MESIIPEESFVWSGNPDKHQLKIEVVSTFKTKMKGINSIVAYNDEEVKKYDYSIIVEQLSKIIDQIGK